MTFQKINLQIIQLDIAESDDPKTLVAVTLTLYAWFEGEGEKDVEQIPLSQLSELTSFSSTLMPS